MCYFPRTVFDPPSYTFLQMGEKIILDQLVILPSIFRVLTSGSIGFTLNGRSTQTLSTITSLLLFVSTQSYPHIRLRSRFLMRVKSDKFSTHYHILKLVLVGLSVTRRDKTTDGREKYFACFLSMSARKSSSKASHCTSRNICIRTRSLATCGRVLAKRLVCILGFAPFLWLMRDAQRT